LSAHLNELCGPPFEKHCSRERDKGQKKKEILDPEAILLKKLEQLGRNSLNFLGKFVRFFVTLRCFYKVVVHRK